MSIKFVILLSLVATLTVSAQPRSLRLLGFGGNIGADYDHECAPVGKCPLPCRLGKETTGCALCVCPPACQPCYSNCYLPSRPDECPLCARPYYCEVGPDSIYPGLSPGLGFPLGR